MMLDVSQVILQGAAFAWMTILCVVLVMALYDEWKESTRSTRTLHLLFTICTIVSTIVLATL